MLSSDYWKAFIDSGIPEYYLLYNKAKKMEGANVPDNNGVSPSGVTL